MNICRCFEISESWRLLKGVSCCVFIIEEAEVAHNLKIVVLWVHRDLIIIHVMLIRVDVIVVWMAPLLARSSVPNFNLHEQLHELLQAVFVRFAFHGILINQSQDAFGENLLINDVGAHV